MSGIAGNIRVVLRVLIVEADPALSTSLFELAQASGFRASFETVAEIAEGSERVLSGDYSVCILGPSCGATNQQRLVLEIKDRPATAGILMVVALRSGDFKLASSILAAGADSVLVEPFDSNVLRAALERAVAAVADGAGSSKSAKTSEQINSLPWILNSLSSRLKSIAERLELEQQRGIKIEGNSKLVKEALLGAIGTKSNDDLVEEILKSAQTVDIHKT